MSVERVEADLFARGDLIGVRGVPLGDAGVEVPAVEVDALVGFEEFGEEFADAGEIFPSRWRKPTTTSATWTPVLSM